MTGTRRTYWVFPETIKKLNKLAKCEDLSISMTLNMLIMGARKVPLAKEFVKAREFRKQALKQIRAGRIQK